MPTFGDYETIGEALPEAVERGGVTTVWKARKSGSSEARFYFIKCYAPRRQTRRQGQSEDVLQGDRALEFLAGIKDLKKAHSQGARCLAPIHDLGLAPEGAWYATDFCERHTLKEFIVTHGKPDTAMLRHIVHSVVTGCLELKRSRGPAQYSHGNLKPSNVLLVGKQRPLRKTPLHLTDPHPSPVQLTTLGPEDQRTVGELLAQVVEVQDLRAIGELILQLVEGHLVSSPDDYNYPVGRSARWDRLGKDREFWRGLCNRLLDPNLSLDRENLEKLEKMFRPRPVHDNLPIIAGVVGVTCLVGVGLYLAWPVPPPRDTLTVAADDKSRDYGEPNPPLTGTASGLWKSDGIRIDYGTSADASSPAGTYSIVPALQDPRNRLSSYAGVITNNGTLTVRPRRLAVKANNQTRSYGAENPKLTGTTDGLRKEDGIGVSYRTEATVSSGAGQYAILPVFSDPSQKLANYLVITNAGTLTVTRVELTASADSKSRYQGDANPTLTGSISGVRVGDLIRKSFHTEATPGSLPGKYPIVPELIDPDKRLSNYNVILNPGTLTVLERPVVPKPLLTITAASQSRNYGTANPPLTGSTNGLRAGDHIDVKFVTTAAESDPVGNYDIVPILSGPNRTLANYTVVTNKGKLTVTPASLTVMATNQSRVYGTPNPPLTGWITPNRDAITATNRTEADVVSAVGNYSIVPALIDPHGKLTNYTVTTNKGILTVTPASLTVTVSNLSRPFGLTNPPLTGWITPNRDGITATYSTKAETTSAEGNYDIVPMLVDKGGRLRNYTVTINKGTLTVFPKTSVPFTVIAHNQNRAYGTTNPPLTGWVTPNGDGISATNSTSADVSSPVGHYDIVPTLIDPHGKLSKYTVTTNKGILTISPAVLTVTASNLSRPFGVANPPLTGWVSSNRDDITATYSTKADASSKPGAYDIVPILSDPGHKLGNYVVTTNRGTLTVTPSNAVTNAIPPHDPVRNLFGIANLDFVWIQGIGPNRSGAYVAVTELSLGQYEHLCERIGLSCASTNEDKSMPVEVPDYQQVKKFLDGLKNLDPKMPDLAAFNWRLPKQQEYRDMLRGEISAERGWKQLPIYGWIPTPERIDRLRESGENLAGGVTGGKLRPAGQGPPTSEGLRDLLGNAREWTSDGQPFGISYRATKSETSLQLDKKPLRGEGEGLRLVIDRRE